MKSESDDSQDQRQQTESGDKQTTIDSCAFERQILAHDGADLTGSTAEAWNDVTVCIPVLNTTVRPAPVRKA